MTRKTVCVSIVIPTYNEERFIALCLDSLLANDYPIEDIEILVLDGRSEDNTPGILRKYSRHYSQIYVFDNVCRVQVRGLNKGFALARGEYILRCDAHCEYPKNYISSIVDYLKKNDLVNAGGSIRAFPSDDSLSARAIAIAMNHSFGVGFSFRTRRSMVEPVVVDTVPFGAWKRETLDKLGCFDEDFIRAQDLELNIRLRKLGGKIVLLPHLVTRYYARNTLKKLIKLSYQMGYAKTQIARKHKCVGSYRQLFPPLFILGLPLTLFSKLLAFFYLSYFIFAFIVGLSVATKERNYRYLPVVVLSFLVMHGVYGIGYVVGFFGNFVIGHGRINWDATR